MTPTIRFFALACTLVLGSCFAQEDAKTAKVKRFVEVSGRAAFGQAMAERTLEKIRGNAGDQLPPGFAEAFVEACDPTALTEALITVYDDLDEATLDAAIAFYSTPAGKELAKLQVQCDVATQDATETWLQAAVNETLKKLGVPTPQEQMKEARRHGNEAAAIGALKTLTTAQALFREGDKDNDGEFQYAGSLAALSKTQLIDEVLGSGTKQGYRFELITGSEAPEFLWAAVASPIDGEGRHFLVNQAGVIYYSNDTPFTLDRTSCKVPDGATPVGR